MAAPPERRIRFGWVVLQGLLWMVLFAVAAATAMTLGEVADRERFRQGVTRAGIFVSLLGMGAAYLVQTGRRVSGRVLQALLLVLVALVAVLPMVVSRGRGPEPLTDDERQALVRQTVDGQPRLIHPTLGFSVADPGPQFVPITGPGAQQIEQNWVLHPEMYGSGWQDVSSSRLLYVIYAKGLEGAEAMRGFTEGMRESLVGGAEVEVLEDRFDPDTLEARFEGHIPSGLYIEMRTLMTQLTTEGPSFVVVVLGISPQRGGLRTILESLGKG